jgi:hypothetical protein
MPIVFEGLTSTVGFGLLQPQRRIHHPRRDLILRHKRIVARAPLFVSSFSFAVLGGLRVKRPSTKRPAINTPAFQPVVSSFGEPHFH